MTMSRHAARRRASYARNALLAFIGALATASSAGAAELVQNGGFEAQGGSLAGWTVNGSVAPFTGAGYVQCCGSFGAEPGFSSNHFATFGAGDAAGVHTLSQTFATVVGAAYHLSFDAGALGLPGDEALLIAAMGSYAGGGIDNTSTADLDGAFKGCSLDFIATAATTTLAFTVATFGVDGHDVVLDDVSLTGDLAAVEVPEPASWTLMLVGFLGTGGAMRRARTRAVAAAR